MEYKKISELTEVLAAGVTVPSTARMPIELSGALVTNFITAEELGTLLGKHAAVTAGNASIALSGQAVSVALDTGGSNLLTLAGAGLRVDVPNDHVTYAKIQNVSATNKLLGRMTAGSGDIEEIDCTAFGRSLIDDADASAGRTTLGLGSVATLSSISYANIQNVSATSRLLGRATTGAGVIEEITIGSGLTLSGTTLSASGGGSITVSGPDKLLGRVSSGSGAVEEIDCTAAARSILDDASVAAIATTLGLGTGSVVTHERQLITQTTANQSGLVISGYSLTGTSTVAAIDISGTWNTTGNASLITANITNTASGGSSKFLDLKIVGTTQAYIRYNGEIYAQSTVIAGGSTTVIGGSTHGLWTTKSVSINSDFNFERDAAGSGGLRNGTSAQKLSVYNTWASSTSYERGVFDWQTTANTLRIGTQKGSGGGSARAISIITDGTERINIATNGNLVSIATITAPNLVGNQGGFYTRSDTAKVYFGASDNLALAWSSAGKLLITDGGSGAGSLVLRDAGNIELATTTGTKIGTATGQKLGFWNATPVVQQVLATGAGATVDNVISLLQTLGLCKQA